MEAQLLGADDRIATEHTPMSKAWSALPFLSGGMILIVALSGEMMCAVFPFQLCHNITMHAMLGAFGVVMMTGALPTIYISEVTESKAFAEMRLHARLSSEDEAQLRERMGKILHKSLLAGRCMFVAFLILTYVACRTTVGALFVGLVVGASSVTHWGQMCFLDELVWLCDKDISKFIRLIKTDSNCNWAKVAAAHHKLDKRLENLWSVGKWLLCPLVARDCAEGVILVVSGTVIREVWIKVALYMVGATILGRAVWTLRGPARVTSHCNSVSTQDSMVAIRAAVHAETCHADMDQSGEISHVRFLQYINSTTIGVKLFGVLMTYDLLLSISVGMATKIPIAAGILQGLIQQSRS